MGCYAAALGVLDDVADTLLAYDPALRCDGDAAWQAVVEEQRAARRERLRGCHHSRT